MPNRIDELFSPQRLRRTWNRRMWNQPACAGTNVNADGSGAASRRGADEERYASSVSADGSGAASWRGADEERYASSEALPAGPQQGIKPEFDRLTRLIRQRFPGKQGEALDIMLENLHKLLTQRFPQTGKTAVPKEAAASEDKAAVPKEAAASEKEAAALEDEAVSGMVGWTKQIPATAGICLSTTNKAIMEDEAIPDDGAIPWNDAIPDDDAIPANDPPSENETVSKGDMTAIDQSIEEVLNQIEDLVEALEL